MSPERRQRIIRILLSFAVVLVALLVFIPPLLGFLTTWGLTHIPCGGGSIPRSAGMTDYEAVSFYSSSLNKPISGYFVHGTNGATIILPPTLNSGAGYWRNDYVILNRFGYNLLNYESRNCAGTTNTLGYAEADQVADALNYLATRPDVDMSRVGIQGFSAGGATSILAAARYPHLKAAVAMGGYHDFGATLDAETLDSWYGPLYAAGARAGYRLATGFSLDVLRPVRAIDQIAPRPVLLIYGTHEPSLAGAYLQQQAAGSNAELWVVEGAGHGNYWDIGPEIFEQRVIGFWDAVFGVER
jgi:pimeloyl-ACP methyl ester carboxylesterase